MENPPLVGISLNCPLDGRVGIQWLKRLWGVYASIG